MLRPHVWLLRVVVVLVPAPLRASWRREWEAELAHREQQLSHLGRPAATRRLELFWRSTSAVWDALWLLPLRLEDEMLQDIRYGARVLRRSPTFSIAAVVSVAVGVGASTAVTSVVSAVLWRPLPYPSPDRIVTIGTNLTSLLTAPAFQDLTARNQVLDLLAAVETTEMTVDGRTGPQQLKGQRVSSTFVRLFGLDTPNAPAPGRAFPPNAFEPESPNTVIISRRFWRQRFNQDPRIVGQTIVMDSQPHEIIGVLPSQFTAFADSDFLLPLRLTPARMSDRYHRSLQLLGRLRPNIELRAAERQLTTITRDLLPEQQARLALFSEVTVGGFRRTLTTMVGVVALVLVIACANFANLLLARSGARQQEVAVRAALGARRLRLVRQLLVESVLLAGVGGVGGVIGAYWLVHFLVVAGPPRFPGCRKSTSTC